MATNNNRCTLDKFFEAFPEERAALEQATQEYIDQRLSLYGVWQCHQCKALMPLELDHCKRCDCRRTEVQIEEEKTKVIPLAKSKSELKRKRHGS